jgi:hypothetical protein
VRTFPYTADAVPATIIDVSRSGMKLELTTPLSRETRIEVLMPLTKLVVFGEVRYCRRSGAVYHAGVLIDDLVQPPSNTSEHVHEDEIVLYIAGKGLSSSELLHVERHVPRCESCKRLMVQLRDSLHPSRRVGPRNDP